MAEYVDLRTNLSALVDIYDWQTFKRNQFDADAKSDKQRKLKEKLCHPQAIHHVRKSVCIAGYDKNAVVSVKSSIADLMRVPLPLESFHVKLSDDVKDGALLVPKVILVAVHFPGKKVIDDSGDNGQLDVIYDEVYTVGADVMVIYVGLPRILYPPLEHGIYHEKIATHLFPTQPILQALAKNHNFITVTDQSDFNELQINLLRQWLDKPVDKSHPIYKTASRLNERSFPKMDCWSDSEVNQSTFCSKDIRSRARVDNEIFVAATEEHPLLNSRRTKPSKIRIFYGTANLTDRSLASRVDCELLLPISENHDQGTEFKLFKESLSYNDNIVRSALV